MAIHPLTHERIPVYIADYVLMGYGTGAIMAVPAHDERDWEFSTKFQIPIRAVVAPSDGAIHPAGQPFIGEGLAVNSPLVEGLTTAKAKQKIIEELERLGVGHGSMTYKLRDWLFSRQRYWGEPFPIVLDAEGRPHALGESELPVTLPELSDFKPTGTPEPPLSKAKDWIRYSATMTREVNTMPQWAGSCWYYLRYIDPHNEFQLVDPAKEKYWMPVDLYVGGVEHAVLHLLYARFWHKVLFDLGVVSTPEPFQRLVNQGLILGETEFHAFHTSDEMMLTASEVKELDEEATDAGVRMIGIDKRTGQKVTGRRLTEEEVEKAGDGFRLRSAPDIRVDARSFKMSKSRGNVVNPDSIVADYGADTFRLYEMYMGPLEAQKPWNTRDIVGMSRFLNKVWRNFVGDSEEDMNPAKVPVSDSSIPDSLDRQMNRTIKKVAEDIETLRFNTAIAELINLNNAMIGLSPLPRELAENFVLMLAPFAPHLAEELWAALGHNKSLARRPWPSFDPAKLIESNMELPVQVNGKLRDRIMVSADADEASILAAAEASDKVRPWTDGKTIKKRLYVPKKLVNLVVG